MSDKFKVGDRVEAVDQEADVPVGSRGTVDECDGDCIPFVLWDAHGSRYECDDFLRLVKEAPPSTPSAISPSHYSRYAIEPVKFIMANNLPYAVGNVVKYVLRYDAKNGREDLLKARQYLDFLIAEIDGKDVSKAV